MSKWSWISVTTRGSSHIKASTRRQDAVRCLETPAPTGFFICVLADGAGTAEFGGEGASVTCRLISNCLKAHLLQTQQLPSDTTVEGWIDEVRDTLGAIASHKNKNLKDFAATLIAVVTDGRKLLILQIGDGCVALKTNELDCWRVPLWPDHGEYASTTYFVTDSSGARYRIFREDVSLQIFVAMTDGLERLGLDFATKTPSDKFFDGMSRALVANPGSGKNRPMSAALKAFLDGESVCARTDDDKTIVIAMPI